MGLSGVSGENETLEYVKHKLGGECPPDILHSVLLWAWFEKGVLLKYKDCENTKQRIDKFVENNHEKVEDIIKEYFCDFCERYRDTEKFNQLFGEKYRNEQKRSLREMKEHTEGVLKCTIERTGESNLKALLYIVYRLRNRLVHGIKPLYKEIDDQEKNFQMVNSFLVEVLKKKGV